MAEWASVVGLMESGIGCVSGRPVWRIWGVYYSYSCYLCAFLVTVCVLRMCLSCWMGCGIPLHVVM